MSKVPPVGPYEAQDLDVPHPPRGDTFLGGEHLYHYTETTTLKLTRNLTSWRLPSAADIKDVYEPHETFATVR